MWWINCMPNSALFATRFRPLAYFIEALNFIVSLETFYINATRLIYVLHVALSPLEGRIGIPNMKLIKRGTGTTCRPNSNSLISLVSFKMIAMYPIPWWRHMSKRWSLMTSGISRYGHKRHMDTCWWHQWHNMSIYGHT